MASHRSFVEKQSDDSNEEEDYDENDVDSSINTTNFSRQSFNQNDNLSRQSFNQNDSIISQRSSSRLSDRSFSPQSTRRRYSPNDSKLSKSPNTPDKIYPTLQNTTPPKKNLYPNLSVTDSPLTSSSKKVMKEANSNYSISSFVYIVTVVIIGLLVVLFISNYKSDSPMFSNDPYENFVQNIRELKYDFPAQRRRTWKIVQATSKHVLNETDPIYPSIVLMASEVENSRLMTCIANKIAEKFKLSTGDRSGKYTTDISSYSNLDPAKQKMELDEAFLKAFNKDGKSILIENLQQLSGEAALLLYKYCDNDNAPFKNVLILLTINVSGEDVDLSESSNIESYLAGVWQKNIHADKVNALMSRVANNIVVIKKESPHVFEQHC